MSLDNIRHIDRQVGECYIQKIFPQRNNVSLIFKLME